MNCCAWYCARSSAHPAVLLMALCAYFARVRRLHAAVFPGSGSQGCAEIGQYAGPSPFSNPQRPRKGP
ncbi:hypothetical protein J3F84DRAFT_355612 [Trichoderma pleuroticola]